MPRWRLNAHRSPSFQGRIDPWLLGLCVLIPALQFIFDFLPQRKQIWIVEHFALSLGGLRSGWLWQFGSHALLHGPLWHLVLNMAAFYLLGRQMIWTLGRGRWLRALLFGVLAGGLGHVLMGVVDGGAFHLIGISGGLCALLGMMTAISPESRMWPLPVSGRNAWLGFTIASAAFILLNPALGLPGLAVLGGELDKLVAGQLFRMAHACHLGGLVAGALYGKWCLRERVSLAALQRQRERNERKLGLAK